MSNQENYQAKLETIQALTLEQTKSPNMPVDVYLQEAENLYHWCQTDQEKLTAIGLDWTLVTDLPVRIGATRQAESLWFNNRFTREEAEREWKEKSPAAYDLRNQLLHDFRFAYRNNPELSNRVRQIADGSGHADMLQDLNDLAELGKANPDPLTSIGFDLAKLDEAANTSNQMAELLSRATTTRVDNSQAKIIRDRAFTHLKEAVDEIRACGQYLFWRDEQRYKGYTSQYHRRHNKSRNTNNEAESDTE